MNLIINILKRLIIKPNKHQNRLQLIKKAKNNFSKTVMNITVVTRLYHSLKIENHLGKRLRLSRSCLLLREFKCNKLICSYPLTILPVAIRKARKSSLITGTSRDSLALEEVKLLRKNLLRKNNIRRNSIT